MGADLHNYPKEIEATKSGMTGKLSYYTHRKIVTFPYGKIVKHPHNKIVNLFSNKFIPSQPHSKIVKLVQSHTGKLSI